MSGPDFSLRSRAAERQWVGCGALISAGASAESSGTPLGKGSKPTVVLVHWAWADASSWSRVVSRLQRDKYPVIAPANPLRGLASDSAHIASVLATIQGPVILIPPGYPGANITPRPLPPGDGTHVDLYINADSSTTFFAGDLSLSTETCSCRTATDSRGAPPLAAPAGGGPDQLAGERGWSSPTVRRFRCWSQTRRFETPPVNPLDLSDDS